MENIKEDEKVIHRREYMLNRKRKLIENKQCPDCRDPNDNGMIKCNKCLDRCRNHKNNRIKNGLCTNCGIVNDSKGNTCNKCREDKAKNKEELKKNNICVKCKGFNDNGKNNCDNCNSVINQRKKDKIKNDKIKNDKCRSCGNIIGKTGKASCEPCLLKQKQRKQEKIDNLRCAKCGNPNDNGKISCNVCLFRQRAHGNLGSATRTDELLNKFDNQNGKCAISKQLITKTNSEIDHIIPRASGGKDNIDNLQFLHPVVNRMKGKLSQEDFIHWCHVIVANNPLPYHC